MERIKWRISVLLAILLVSLAYLLFGSGRYFPFPEFTGKPSTVLTGDNRIISVRLVDVNPYMATLEVEYFYNGAAGPVARLTLAIDNGAPNASTSTTAPRKPQTTSVAKSGQQKQRVLIQRTHPPFDARMFLTPLHTQWVDARLSSNTNEVLAHNRNDLPIDWPSADPFVLSNTSDKEIDRLYQLCVKTIDSGVQFDQVKKGLEQLLLAKPDFVPAYAELARYQMKTNWSRAGLEQAEQSLNSALRIDPNHSNSWVLIGYVYTHQHRFKEADAAFQKAEKAGTKNIWLYANWGELRAMEGKRQGAIEMYRKAVDAPKDLETYERARKDAYQHLLALLETNKQWREADALYQERLTRYPDNGCFRADYAAFFLDRRGDYDRAITEGTKALQQSCARDDSDTRLILAKAYYTKWATQISHGTDAREADQSFSRGQALYSEMASLMHSLATSTYTAPAIPALKRRGIKIDVADRNGLTPLAFCILNRDTAAAVTLIRYGADVNQRLNEDGLTPLMMAASRGDQEMVLLLIKKGADTRRKTVSGYNAERIALERGFGTIANLISGRSRL